MSFLQLLHYTCNVLNFFTEDIFVGTSTFILLIINFNVQFNSKFYEGNVKMSENYKQTPVNPPQGATNVDTLSLFFHIFSFPFKALPNPVPCFESYIS